ncbi:BTAD domain-containing putative transcriptional regulator [Streptomyces sp. NPDC088747]|uniref:AfsR/SARP family transcriptional regulator n=1 Tax=Streptomyces sp. NPDC088747 TaxID=3365886 RepID=UPI003812551F
MNRPHDNSSTTADGRLRLRFTLLGPMQVTHRGRSFVPGSPQQQALLAVLLLHRGQTVPVQEIVTAIWGETAPTRAVGIIRTYASRLRTIVDQLVAAGSGLQGTAASARPGHLVLESAVGGYRIPQQYAALDLDDVSTATTRLGHAATAADHEAVVSWGRTALAHWRGEALSQIPGPYAAAQRGSLQEQRLALVVRTAQAAVALGRYQDVIDQLTLETTAHPHQEVLHALLITALHRGGHTADAHRALHRAEKSLDELGTLPGPVLNDAAAEIRNTTGPDPEQRHTAGPFPDTIKDFTGREQEVDALTALLGSPQDCATATAVRVVVLTGMGGIGKTTLALHLVHQLTAAFPDGRLYADLRGAGTSPADPAHVAASFLRQLDVPDEQIPAELAERSALLRSVLSSRRILLVLDNAADSEQLRHLLPSTPPTAVIVTSRHPLTSLAALVRAPIAEFSEIEGLQLLHRNLGTTLTPNERQAATELVRQCGGLPLALRIAAAHLTRLNAVGATPIADLLLQLAKERKASPDISTSVAASGIDTAVSSVLSLGYHKLDPHQQRAFRLLAVPETSLIQPAEAAATLDRPLDEITRTLDDLVDAGMLQTPAFERYRFHDLVRIFARHRSAAEDTAADRHEALRRLLQHHISTALMAYRVIRPGHTLPSTLLATHALALPTGANTLDSISAWGRLEVGSLLTLLAQTARTHTSLAADLLLALDPVLEHGHRWKEAEPVALALAEAASKASLPAAEARARYMLAGARAQKDAFGEATTDALLAIALADRVEDLAVLAMAYNVRAFALQGQENPLDAMADAVHRGLDAARQDGNPSTEAMLLGNWIQHRLIEGICDTSVIDDTHKNISLTRELADRHGEAQAYYRYGQVLRLQDNVKDALHAHQRTLELLGPNDQQFLQAATLVRIGMCQRDLGHLRDALTTAERSVDLGRRIGYQHLEAAAEDSWGDTLRALHDIVGAREHWTNARTLYRALTLDVRVTELNKKISATASYT